MVEGSDNGINHAVGVVGDWVFKTNCKRALNAWLLIVSSANGDDKLSAGVAIGNWMIDGKSSEFVYMDKVFWNKHKIIRGYHLGIREFGTLHSTFNQFLAMHPIMKCGVETSQ